MKALLDPGAVHGMPGVQQWMSHGNAARDRVRRSFLLARREEQLQRLTEYNVLNKSKISRHPV